jgi:hypothetical protein
MLLSAKLGLVLVLFMWKQQVQLLQTKPFVTHLWQAPHLPERLPIIIINILTDKTFI